MLKLSGDFLSSIIRRARIFNAMRLFILFFLILNLNGCAWISLKRTEPSQSTISMQAGKVLDPKILNAAQTICIIPFTAGVNVESNIKVNRASLMIVKGITETLEQSNSPFKVLFGESAYDADLIISGRITEVKRTSLLKRLMKKPDILHMEIDAKMSDRVSKKQVAIFQNKRDSQNKQQTLSELGYLIGQDMGSFLDSASEKTGENK